MLVKHLVRELLKCPQDFEVLTEGWGDYSESYAVSINSQGLVEINESPDGEYDNTQDTPRPFKEATK